MSGSLANTGTGGRTERGRSPSRLRLREAAKQKEEGSLSGSPAEAILPGGHAIGDYLTGLEGLEILAEVAHDLRSPLTSILTLAETLQRGASGEVNELQTRQLGLIYSAALALSSTTSDIIELAHGGERLADREPMPFSVHEILESVTDIVQPMADEKGIEIKTLPPISDQRLGYPLPLSRVLLNLTTNSLKFIEEGYVELSLHSAGCSRVVVSVRDTGPGINLEALATLYQPFRSAPQRGDGGHVFSGTGLGLAICRKLVQAMDSRLELETRPNWGTRFFFGLELPPVDLPRA